MLANFFEKTKPINSIVLGGLFCVFYLMAVLVSEEHVFTVFFVGKLFGLLLLHLLFLLLSGQNFIKFSVSNNNLYAALLMVLAYGMFPKAIQIDFSIAIVLAIVFFYRRITSLIKKDNLTSKLFDIGLLLGLAIPFFNWTILYFLVVIIAVIIFTNYTIRKFILPLVGILVPSLFFFTYCYLTDAMPFFYKQYTFSIQFSNVLIDENWLSFIVLGVLAFFSLMVNFVRIIAVSNSYRLHYVITLGMLFVGVVLIYMSPEKKGSELLLLFIPVSLLVGQLIEVLPRQWLKEVTLLCLALFALVNFFL